jgi:arsenate reductase (glutaredoxin)
MPNGTVKFFNDAKGFGFVTLDEGGKDVFLPAVSVTSSGLPGLKAGQRISFDVQPDGKGPKAVDLKLLASPPPVEVQRRQPQKAAETRDETLLTIYCDPAWDKSVEVIAEFRAAGIEPRVVNYLETPPTRDELKGLSALMRDNGQSLVRQFDPLFQALNLDDRFISENEYWDGIVEHPSLINGPLVSTATKAGVCRSKDAVKAFLAVAPSKIVPSLPGKKSISPRLLQLMGGAMPALPAAKEEPVEKVEKQIVKPVLAKPAPVTAQKIKLAAKTDKAAAPVKKPATKVVEKKPKAKSASVPKTKQVAKAPARKVAKKSVRSGRK